MVETASTESFYSARPRIEIAGEIAQDLVDGVLSLAVHEDAQGLYRCEATFGNWGSGAQASGDVGYLYFNRQLLDFGASLKVTTGSSEAEGTIFDGRIMAIEGRFPAQSPPEILILAEDKFQDLRMGRKSRSFEDVTIEDLAGRIAREHGLAAETDAPGPIYRVLTQLNRSDLAFLRDCARRVDAEVWIEGDTLRMQARARRETDAVSLVFGERLREASICADLAQQRSALVLGGWNVTAKAAIEVRADATCLGAELGENQSAEAVLTASLGERVERLVREVSLDDTEAQALAEADYRRRARRFLTGHAICEGDARIRVGAKVTLGSLGALFDGDYYVAEATHLFDQKQGYLTRFAVERPGLGRA